VPPVRPHPRLVPAGDREAIPGKADGPSRLFRISAVSEEIGGKAERVARLFCELPELDGGVATISLLPGSDKRR